MLLTYVQGTPISNFVTAVRPTVGATELHLRNTWGPCTRQSLSGHGRNRDMGQMDVEVSTTLPYHDHDHQPSGHRDFSSGQLGPGGGWR